MKTKRFLSILLSLVLVLGMLPGMSLTASAEGNTKTITSPATTGTMTITLTIAEATHSVTITAGENMTTTGNASQTGLSGAMTDVVYTADDGYYFPTDYSVAAVNGITVTRDGFTQITVSGTPTADAEITLPAPTQKTTPDAPTTAAATGCTTADNNDGKLTGVTTAMEYKKSDAADWTAGTGSDITGLVPGTYYVRVKATETTNASANQELTIKGFISYTVTFKVVNGKWNEGEGDAATADKTVTLTGHDGDTLKLTADQIPAVGTKPNDTYKAGSWDVTPNADTEITADTTYTYTYAQKDSISQTVTFKVVNGSWNDETTTDKTVTLTGYEGDTLNLTTDQIPAVGTKPKDTYKAGSWDVTPNADTEITADTTYTYTYAQKDSISQTVTFKVANGSWNDETTADKTVTLTGYEGDTLKLTADQIPAVGTKPNDTYKAGSWDVTPSTDTEITEATTYTYTYAQKEAATVTKTPTAKSLTYNGQAQALVTAGEAEGGEMQYALGDANGATQPYTTSIPAKTDAGTYYVWYKVKADDTHIDSNPFCVTVKISKKPAEEEEPEKPAEVKTVAMYRLYNPFNREHLYTESENEKNVLSTKYGWKYEGIAWYAPEKSNTPVYRLYNPVLRDHHYTTDKHEKDVLSTKYGWKYEGIGWYSDDNKTVPIYRVFCPFITSGSHHFTAGKNEVKHLISVGWIDEKIGWYGVKEK